MAGNAQQVLPGKQEFVARFGALYENSPWIAEKVWDSLSTEMTEWRLVEFKELDQRFHRVLQNASYLQQLDLLRAHPELACAEADKDSLTLESQNEQSRAGLDECTAQELEAFGRLNRAYGEKFGFPFILAVKGYHRKEILEIFRQRAANDSQEEFTEALRQVCRIGSLRLEALLNE